MACNSAESDPESPRPVTVVVVDPDGTAHRRRWHPGPAGGLLPQLQHAVGGLVDVVALTPRLDMWVHDEGLYLCDPNPVATVLAGLLGAAQAYFGPAVFTGGVDRHGTVLPLEPGTAGWLLTAARLIRADTATVAAVTRHSTWLAAAYR